MLILSGCKDDVFGPPKEPFFHAMKFSLPQVVFPKIARLKGAQEKSSHHNYSLSIRYDDLCVYRVGFFRMVFVAVKRGLFTICSCKGKSALAASRRADADHRALGSAKRRRDHAGC